MAENVKAISLPNTKMERKFEDQKRIFYQEQTDNIEETIVRMPSTSRSR